MYLLGISALYHDSAAALNKDGEIIAAAQEERFTRIKCDKTFSIIASKYCLKVAGINIDDVEAVVFYDNPLLTLDRFLRNILALGKNRTSLFTEVFSLCLVKRYGYMNWYHWSWVG